MTVLENCITIRFTSPAEERPAVPNQEETQEQKRNRFWQLLIAETKSDYKPPRDAKAWEQIFINTFGRNLRQEMLRTLSQGSIYVNPEYGAPPIGERPPRYDDLLLVTIKVTKVSYSNPMDAFLSIFSPELLLKFFTDLVSFIAFFESLVITALLATTENSDFARQMGIEVIANNSLISQFGRKDGGASPTSGSGKDADGGIAAALRGMTQASGQTARGAAPYLLPVVIAVYLFYIGYAALNAAQERQEKLMDSVFSWQSKLLEEDRARLANYNIFQETIIRDRLGLPTITPVITATATATTTNTLPAPTVPITP